VNMNISVISLRWAVEKPRFCEIDKVASTDL
jgi:hypothetical protein